MIVHGAGEPLVPAHLHFGRFVMERMRRVDPHRTCLHHLGSGARLSYGEFVRLAGALAAALGRLGARRGAAVAVLGEPRPASLAAGLAALLAGAAYTPIELEAGRGLLAHKLNLTKPKYAICSRQFWEAYRDILQGSEFIETLISFEPVEGIDLCVETLVRDAGEGEGKVEGGAGGARGDDAALLVYSSGTTGLPKGVLLSHLNCLTTMHIGVQESQEIDTAKSFFLQTEMCTSYGALTAFNCLFKGKTLLYSEYKVELNILRENQVDAMLTTPTVLEELVAAAAAAECPLGSLRLLISAGAVLSPAVVETFQQRFPEVKLVDAYGCTEMGKVAFRLHTDRGGGVVGAGVCVKVVDETSRVLLGPGQVGEICVRGPGLMRGYLGAPSPLDEQGFFPTGDRGACDECGRLRVVGRLTDVITCESNKKVSPSELEAVLCAHEAVRAAAVVGAPAPGRAGLQRPAAFVELHAGAAATPAELQDYVDQQVTWYMRLTGGVRLVEALPRTRTGKVLRRRLREMLLEDAAADASG